MIETVYIQCDGTGRYPNGALFNAAQGFEIRGRDVLPIMNGVLEEIKPEKETLVFGGVDFVLPYLERLGCKPEPLDYPELLQHFMASSQATTSTLGKVRRQLQEGCDPIFIKPIAHKVFTGCVAHKRIDITHFNHVEDKTPVWVRPPVHMVSEWRFYVEDKEVVGADHYKGDPLFFPGRHPVQQMVRTIAADMPVCFSLDVACTEDEMPMPIEVNDMVCLGSYGLDPCIYARMIESRWNQLVGFEE